MCLEYVTSSNKSIKITEILHNVSSTSSYQCISGFVLVDGADSCPIKVLKQADAWQVERVLRGHDAEEVRERLLREHRVGVRVGQLKKLT